MKSVIDIYVYNAIWLTYRLRPIYYTFARRTDVLAIILVSKW
jgi:hypothetical protein